MPDINPEDIDKLVEALKQQIAQKAQMKAVQDAATSKAAKDAVGKQIAEAQKIIDKKAGELAEGLEALGESQAWKVGKLPGKIVRLLKALGFDVGEAFGEEVAIKAASKASTVAAEAVAGAATKIFGAFFAAILDVFLDQTEISGVEKREVDSKIVRIKGKCYRISFYQVRGMDELIWSDVRSEVVEIDCPELLP